MVTRGSSGPCSACSHGIRVWSGSTLELARVSAVTARPRAAAPHQGPCQILSLVQVEGQALSAATEAAVPWPLLSPRPAPPHPDLSSTAPPPGAATLAHASPSCSACPASSRFPQFSARTLGLRALSRRPLPALASAVSSLGSPVSPSTHYSPVPACGATSLPSQATRFGGGQATLSPGGHQFPAQCPDVIGGQHIFVENLRL